MAQQKIRFSPKIQNTFLVNPYDAHDSFYTYQYGPKLG